MFFRLLLLDVTLPDVKQFDHDLTHQEDRVSRRRRTACSRDVIVGQYFKAIHGINWDQSCKTLFGITEGTCGNHIRVREPEVLFRGNILL